MNSSIYYLYIFNNNIVNDSCINMYRCICINISKCSVTHPPLSATGFSAVKSNIHFRLLVITKMIIYNDELKN